MAKIALPTRVMWGRHDPVLEGRLVDRLPDYFEDPEVTITEDAAATAIATFFERVPW